MLWKACIKKMFGILVATTALWGQECADTGPGGSWQ